MGTFNHQFKTRGLLSFISFLRIDSMFVSLPVQGWFLESLVQLVQTRWWLAGLGRCWTVFKSLNSHCKALDGEIKNLGGNLETILLRKIRHLGVIAGINLDYCPWFLKLLGGWP